MKTVFVLLDSLNRHMLRIYNPEAIPETPNFERLAEKSVVFENHWVGSAPCMPARRDLLTGRLNFLERNWGPIEPFDITLPPLLKQKGIFSHIVTDHYHYFEVGGENYCQAYNTWELHRGQEWDPWISRVKRPDPPKEHYGRYQDEHTLNLTNMHSEEDYPSPKTFASACKWLEANREAEDFFLVVEAFDPHEPFDSTEEYLEMYEKDYDGPEFDWPFYGPVTEPPEAIAHIRKKYAATLTMTDRWLGKLLDVMDKNKLWEDTLFILTTDHGHMLGEHDFLGKSVMHMYNELSHLPLLIHLPGGDRAGERVEALTQNIDIMPTLLDYYGVKSPDVLHGHSLRGILEKKEEKVRDVALFGYHGKAVNITDGVHTYFAAPANPDNYPCYIYGAMPTTFMEYMGVEFTDETKSGGHLSNYCIGKEQFKHVEMGRFLKHTDYPVYKIPLTTRDVVDGSVKYLTESFIFNIKEDYAQLHPIEDEEIRNEMKEKLIKAMQEADAPEEQFTRLGLVP